MKRFLAVLAASVAMFGAAASSASADTVASFNGCTYHGASYLDVVEQWWAAGSPSCGLGYVLSVSIDTTVSGTVPPSDDVPSDDEESAERSSWG